MVRRLRHANAQSEVNFPFGRHIQVDHRENLLLLLRRRVEILRRSEYSVIFDYTRDFFRKVVTHLRVRRKDESLTRGRPIERFVESRVKCEIPASHLLIYDWTQLIRPGIRGKRGALIPELLRNAHAYRPMPTGWHSHARSNVIAHIVPSIPVLDRSKKIESGFKPVVEPVSDFESFVQLVVGGNRSIGAGGVAS